MKRCIAILLAAFMILSLAACGNSKDETIGGSLGSQFKELVGSDPEMSVQDIADKLLTNPVLEFNGATMPVEEGLLTGFDNAEIAGFDEGVMFSPVIGTMPFVGYVFSLKDGTDVEEFKKTLNDSANLRWNVCTEADELYVSSEGSKVLFVMAPKSFDEAE